MHARAATLHANEHAPASQWSPALVVVGSPVVPIIGDAPQPLLLPTRLHG